MIPEGMMLVRISSLEELLDVTIARGEELPLLIQDGYFRKWLAEVRALKQVDQADPARPAGEPNR